MADELVQLARAAEGLAQAIVSYQRAIAAARVAGASWGEMAAAMNIPRESVRGRVRAVTQGGEMHIKVPSPREEA